MKQAASCILFFIAGFAFCFHYFAPNKKETTNPTPISTSEYVSPPPRPHDYSQLYKTIYHEMGLTNGDVIKEVNGKGGNNAASMFTELVLGYQNKNLCVKFERNGSTQRTCLQKYHPPTADLKDLLRDARPKEIQPIYTEAQLKEEYARDPDALFRDHLVPEVDPKTGEVTGYKKVNP